MNKKFLLLLALPLIIPATLLLRKPEPGCSQMVEVSIGNFPSLAAGQSAALKQLACETKKCPNAQKFRILRNNVGIAAWINEDYALTYYDRKNGFLQDGVPIYGANTQWRKVNDKSIEKVASASARFNDFSKYGGVYAMP